MKEVVFTSFYTEKGLYPKFFDFSHDDTEPFIIIYMKKITWFREKCNLSITPVQIKEDRDFGLIG